MFETDSRVCRGCLSADRKRIPVSPGDLMLYYTLLADDRKVDALSMPGVALCWECEALLRRTREFRAQIQQAHTILEDHLGYPPDNTTLSSLTLRHKLEYDAILEETEPNDQPLFCNMNAPQITRDKIVIPTKYKAQVKDLDKARDFKDDSKQHDFQIQNISDESDDSDCYEPFDTSDVSTSSLEMNYRNLTPLNKIQDSKNVTTIDNDSNLDDIKSEKEKAKPRSMVNNKRNVPFVKTPAIVKLELELQKIMQSNALNVTSVQRKTPKQNTKKESKHSDTKPESSNKTANVKHEVIACKNKDDSESSTDDEVSNDDRKKYKSYKLNKTLDPDFNLNEDEGSASDDSRIDKKEEKKLEGYNNKRQIQKRYKKIITRHKHIDEVLSCFTEIEMSVDEIKSVLEKEDAIVNEKKPHKCTICGQQFTLRRSLTHHASIYHKATHRDCFRKGDFYSPPPTMSEKSLWRCSVCSRMVRRKHILAHMNELHRTQYFCNGDGCEWSQKVFWVVEEHAQHWAAVHRQCACDDCGAQERNKAKMETHIITKHLRLPKQKCVECDRMFPHAAALRRHAARRHARPAPAELRYCVECDRTFQTVVRLQKHFHYKHNSARKTYPCGECGRVLTTKTSFRNHYDIKHAGKTNYCCHVCGKCLSKAQALKQHLKAHLNIKKPKTKPCTICGQMFTDARVLRHHTYTHTGERPYACAHCGAAYTQPHCLRVHLMKRHGIEQSVTVKQFHDTGCK